jgi:hypothetical protein
MGFLFGHQHSMATQPPDLNGMHMQNSAYGLCIPIVYGTMRVSMNVIWATPVWAVGTTHEEGGKGLGGGASQTTYEYYMGVLGGLCEGPIHYIKRYWQGKDAYPSLRGGHYGDVFWFIYEGWQGQAQAAYFNSSYQSQGLGYNLLAYCFRPNVYLGDSPDLPNCSFEIVGKGSELYDEVTLVNPDALPSFILYDLLTNPQYGAGFPTSSFYGGQRDLEIANYGAQQDLWSTDFDKYCEAVNLYISASFDTQRSAADIVKEICLISNAAPVWTGDSLKVLPLCDAPVSGFTPNVTPVAGITESDILEPIQITRATPADAYNSQQVEYLDRSHDYNPTIVEARNDAAVRTYGLRPAPPLQLHEITTVNVAMQVAQLSVQRSITLLNKYTLKLSARWQLLDPMDIIAVSDTRENMSDALLRIQTVTLNEDGSVSIEAEDFIPGTYTPAMYASPTADSGGSNASDATANCAAPVIFPSSAAYSPNQRELCLATAGPQPLEAWTSGHNYSVGNIVTYGDLQYICIAAVTADTVPPYEDATHWQVCSWGGCNVWVSTDNQTYAQVGTITQAARYGKLVAELPPGETFPTADTTNTLSVDLTQSGGKLLSASQADADALRTLLWVDGEYMAYETAQLRSVAPTGPNLFDLTYLQRGVYDTSSKDHLAGASIVRLDSAVLHVPCNVATGATVYVKLQSFNAVGGALQDLSTLTPYTHVVDLPAIAAPTSLAIVQTGQSQAAYLAQWTANRALRTLSVFQRAYSATPGNPDTDSAWTLAQTFSLATVAPDGSIGCGALAQAFNLGFMAGGQSNVAVQLTDAWGEKSGWVVIDGERPSTVVTSDYTIQPVDYMILADATAGAFAVTLPASASTGQSYIVQKTDTSANEVTVNGVALGTQGATVTWTWNGSAWIMTGRF